MNKMIRKIELDLGGKIVSLTPTQAKNLKEALDELFGKKVIREIARDREYVPYPPLVPPYPCFPYRPYWTEWTWCSDVGTADLPSRVTVDSNTSTLCL